MLSLPAVAEAAVVGKPDMALGETIKCYIVLKEGQNLNKEDIKAYCKEKLGPYKTPSEIIFIDELPKGPSGKIQKRVLREREFQDLMVVFKGLIKHQALQRAGHPKVNVISRKHNRLIII